MANRNNYHSNYANNIKAAPVVIPSRWTVGVRRTSETRLPDGNIRRDTTVIPAPSPRAIIPREMSAGSGVYNRQGERIDYIPGEVQDAMTVPDLVEKVPVMGPVIRKKIFKQGGYIKYFN